jgi:hypothetical protein
MSKGFVIGGTIAALALAGCAYYVMQKRPAGVAGANTVNRLPPAVQSPAPAPAGALSIPGTPISVDPWAIAAKGTGLLSNWANSDDSP